MSEFKLFDYDVWGNNKDGFEINDVYSSPIHVELHECCTDKEIIQELKKINYFKKTVKNSFFSIEGEFGNTLYIYHSTQKKSFYPVCELRNTESY